MSGDPSEREVLEALSKVRDPELEHDIVSLGLVKNLLIDEETIRFGLDVIGRKDAARDRLLKEAMGAAETVGGERSVEIELLTEPPRKREQEKEEDKGPDPWADRRPIPGVKRMLAVASGKGGVGKSTVAVNLAAAFAGHGLKVGILDADVYGPSVAMLMGVPHGEHPHALGESIVPIERNGIKLMSIAFLLPTERAPIIWRGPMVANMVKTMLRQVLWGALDIIVVDLPPGTGDAQLTLVQNVPLDGVVVVTTPQQLAALDASRGVEMFTRLGVPVLGIVENMSSFVCPGCGAVHDLFPRGGVERVLQQYDTRLLARLPMDPLVGAHGDEGTPTVFEAPQSPLSKALSDAAAVLERELLG